jgi:general secretion pathway protein K
MKKGFALALTLWIVAMLSLVSVLYLSYGKKVVQKTIQLNKKLELIFEEESTIEQLKFYIATGYIDKDRVVNNSFSNLFPSFPTFFYIDGQPTRLDNRTITLQDTAGLINIHDDEAFSRYLSKDLNIEERGIISDSMRDWLDLDSFSSLNGAETPFYQQKRYAYEARDENYISSIDEIFLIRGVDKYTRIDQEKLTLSNIVIRNILTMSPKLLGKIYGFTPNEIEQLIEAKKEGKEFFSNLFYRLNIYNQRPELDGFIASNILKIDIFTKRDNISKKIKLLVSFRPNREGAFKVLEYYD